MEELRKLLEEIVNQELILVILSNSRDMERGKKVRIRPVLIRGELLFQETLYRGTQVFHGNYGRQEIMDRIQDYLNGLFKQGEFKALSQEATVLVSRRGRITVRRRSSGMGGGNGGNPDGAASRKPGSQMEGGKPGSGMEGGKTGSQMEGTPPEGAVPAHNRTKHYILEEGKPVDFLVELGVQMPDGRVVRAKYDKFRQINRYLEFIEDVLEELPADRSLRIIDFGCGKSYLTFAMYYYLHELRHRPLCITGLDLKAEVIAHCNELAEKLGYAELHFEKGDISAYEGADAADMVVSLHACDTATDYALEKAVKWNASVIMAVPCCQHELNRQIKCTALQPVLKYGVLKERLAALVTDALRAELLEQQGYETQLLEFIDMEHTPKNLLIRAVKRKGMQPKGRRGDISGVTELLQVSPTLERLLKE